MRMKEYRFTEDELIILREATLEYNFFLKDQIEKDCHSSDKMKRNRKIAHSLFEQFRDDILILK